ncbi:hypothetical protein [Desulfocurvus sp. DL9XJH121]
MFPLIKEGTSGILTLSGPTGRGRDWCPHNDLESPMRWLLDFWELRNQDGSPLKDNYRLHGYNWLSSQVNFLFWRVFFRYAQYGELLRELEGKRPRFVNKLNFARIWDLTHPPRTWKFWRRPAFVRATHQRNQALCTGGPRKGVLFYRYGPGDFRSRDMLRVFQERNTPFIHAFSPSRKLLKDTAAQGPDKPETYFLYRDLAAPRVFRNTYDLSGREPSEARFLGAVIESIEQRMSDNVREYELHKENLARLQPRVFFGIDDANEVYPALFACKDLGIPSVGYQLGMYAKRQAGYTIPGWGQGEYQWFDHVISWGPYWENALLRHSDAYPEGFFLPGTNKLAFGYRRLESERFNVKNVLVPYEFWGNTRTLGRFIIKFMDLGYTVYFKFKPDERPHRQLDSYRLPEDYRSRLVEVFDVTDELMAEVNIVAGAMTTLLYDLLPYGKHTWVLDTEFRLLDDMVADGLARKVTLADLEAMGEPERADRHMDYATLFRDMTLDQALERHVLGLLD